MRNDYIETAEFDEYVKHYEEQHKQNIKISGEDPEYFAEYKIRLLQTKFNPDATNKILDYGAGIGGSIPYWNKYFPRSDIECLDNSKASLQLAEKRYGQGAKYTHYDGSSIPAEVNSYDLIFAACVFHHIPQKSHHSSLMEIHRTLKDGAHFALFEHNPLNPLTRHAVNTCPFDKNAVLIGANEMRKRILNAGFSSAHIKYCIFFPSLLGFMRPLEKHLGWLPIGAQYVIFAQK